MKNALIPLILTAGSICMADDTQPLKFSLREVEFCSFLPYGQCPDEDFDTAVNLIWSAPFEGDTQTGDYADEYEKKKKNALTMENALTMVPPTLLLRKLFSSAT